MGTSYVTSNQGRPIQGVSQQPEKTRLPGQCTTSDNLRPDVVQGLITRPGTDLTADLTTALASTTSMWYHYERGVSEEYFISIEATTGKTRVWSPDGQEHIVNVQDNSEAAYLASAQPLSDLRAITIGDFTFFVNREIVVEASTTNTTAISEEALFYCQFIDYAQTQSITLDGVEVAKFKTRNGDNPTDIKGTIPNRVCEVLVLALGGNTASDDGGAWESPTGDVSGTYNFEQVENTIVISRVDSAAFTISVSDYVDGENAVGIQGKLEDTALLPGVAPEGFLIEIDPPGANDENSNNFWLKAVNTDADHITWREAIAPGISVGPDKSTMPHVLVRESIDGLGVATFTLREGEWEDRKVGSNDTNPQPTFIDSTITSIGMMQNRILFTSGESVIMSRSDKFFDFYRSTAQASLDTDPIDVFADVPQVNFLESHIAFDGDLVFFSKSGQFLMDGSKPLTKTTATLRQVTSFETEMLVDPVATGDAIMFAFKYGNFTGIREFFTDSVTDTKKARPITDHVKKYLIGQPSMMKASTSLNILAVKTTNDDNVLYLYDWLWQGAEKVQSAWGRFIFPAGSNILHFEFNEEKLYLVMLHGSEVSIEVLDMGDSPNDDTGFHIGLDRKRGLTFTYSTINERWEATDPLPSVDIADLRAILTTGYASDVGLALLLERDGALLVTEDDMSDQPTAVTEVGVTFQQTYTPTNPVPLDQNGQAMNLDRLTIKAFYMNYETAGELTAIVTNASGSVRSVDYNHRRFGAANNIVGFAPLSEGVYKIPIKQKSDRYDLTFTTDSYLPLRVRDFSFDGTLSRRGRRL